MKSTLLPTLALTALCTAVSTLYAAAPHNPAGFEIHRGTNLSHWLSQDFGWAPRESWITEKDIQFIAKQGFDHVRLPLDQKELWLDNGTPNETEFKRLLTALDWCHKAGLRVIVDLHTVKSHHFNASNEGLSNTLWSDPKAQDEFISLWRTLSARLRHLPIDAVAYEILNEAVADNHDDWNKLVAKALTVLRQLEPKRVVVIGANKWQMPQNIPSLTVPEGDKNIILSFHTYSPMLFTHHGADWVPIKTYKGKVSYPGPVVDKKTYEKLMKDTTPGFTDLVQGGNDDWGQARMLKEYEPAIKRARELGLQLYCGEFGVMPSVPRKDRLQYYRDIVSVLEGQDIAWANWEYKGDFGLYEWKGLPVQQTQPDTELIQALLHKK